MLVTAGRVDPVAALPLNTTHRKKTSVWADGVIFVHGDVIVPDVSNDIDGSVVPLRNDHAALLSSFDADTTAKNCGANHPAGRDGDLGGTRTIILDCEYPVKSNITRAPLSGSSIPPEGTVSNISAPKILLKLISAGATVDLVAHDADAAKDAESANTACDAETAKDAESASNACDAETTKDAESASSACDAETTKDADTACSAHDAVPINPTGRVSSAINEPENAPLTGLLKNNSNGINFTSYRLFES